MSEQWVWEPVGVTDNGEIVRCACGNPDCNSYVHVDVDGQELYAAHGDSFDDGDVRIYLPDDVRLCRRVPATAGSVPVEAIFRLVTLAGMECKCLGDAAQVLAWLSRVTAAEQHAQDSQGEG